MKVLLTISLLLSFSALAQGNGPTNSNITRFSPTESFNGALGVINPDGEASVKLAFFYSGSDIERSAIRLADFKADCLGPTNDFLQERVKAHFKGKVKVSTSVSKTIDRCTRGPGRQAEGCESAYSCQISVKVLDPKLKLIDEKKSQTKGYSIEKAEEAMKELYADDQVLALISNRGWTGRNRGRFYVLKLIAK